MTNTEEKRWIQQRLESVVGQASYSVEEKKGFLKQLTAAEGLERYLGAKSPGAKRFSPVSYTHLTLPTICSV